MNEQETYDQFYQDMVAIATKYSMDRLRVTTLNFDREFKRGQDGSFNLVGTKAVIRVLGKTTKVPIGEGTPYATYEEAWEATKKYWSEYYREIRARRTPAQQVAEAKRQKRYREKRKDTIETWRRQQ